MENFGDVLILRIFTDQDTPACFHILKHNSVLLTNYFYSEAKNFQNDITEDNFYRTTKLKTTNYQNYPTGILYN